VQFPLAEMRRLCGDATLYARPGDASDLADRIAELLDDAVLRERVGAAGRKRVHDGLMWSDQVTALLAALEVARAAGRGRLS
jgi:glycosyltransferase involved in cell wall biosynthesis